MSMVMVMGWEAAVMGARGSAGAVVSGLGVISRNCNGWGQGCAAEQIDYSRGLVPCSVTGDDLMLHWPRESASLPLRAEEGVELAGLKYFKAGSGIKRGLAELCAALDLV
jgi:hypothetical protein